MDEGASLGEGADRLIAVADIPGAQPVAPAGPAHSLVDTRRITRDVTGLVSRFAVGPPHERVLQAQLTGEGASLGEGADRLIAFTDVPGAQPVPHASPAQSLVRPRW